MNVQPIQEIRIMDRSSKIILITGATAGIGRFLALDLASRGHRVFATGRKEDALSSLRDEAASQGSPLDTLVLDVTSSESIEAARRELLARTDGHGVDVLVNNAGYGQAGPLIEVDDATLRAQFDTNVFGLMAVTRAFSGPMLGRGHGRILNVSSIGGRVTFPFFGAYHASKYALEAMSDALRAELRPFGVRVVLIEPGPITSKFSERAFGSLPSAQSGSPYAASYALAGGIRTASDRASFGPEHVSRAVLRAIGSRWPSARYVAPWFLALPLAFMALMPTRLRDAIFRRVFGLGTRRPAGVLAAAASPEAVGS
jgi:NAD(P)-dependent dehydrogenase (short-subunit alcohol dehydrogenase family)